MSVLVTFLYEWLRGFRSLKLARRASVGSADGGQEGRPHQAARVPESAAGGAEGLLEESVPRRKIAAQCGFRTVHR